MDIDYGRIGFNIRQNRKLHHMTQKQIAEALGCTSEHFSHIEKGDRHIQFEMILEICEILNISIEDIIDGATGIPISRKAALSPISTSLENEFVTMVRGLSAQKATALLKVCHEILQLSRMQ